MSNYLYHDCDERGCQGPLRRAHERTAHLRRERIRDKFRRAGAPTPRASRALLSPRRETETLTLTSAGGRVIRRVKFL